METPILLNIYLTAAPTSADHHLIDSEIANLVGEGHRLAGTVRLGKKI